MDESKFKAICNRNSFYISLEDQKEAVSRLERDLRPLRLIVSKDHKTHVHLAVQHGQHWAAVQISISPFSLRSIPGQRFYSCCFRYTSCCETFVPKDVLSDVVQSVYDVYYQPTQWDFSSKHWYVLESCRLDQIYSQVPATPAIQLHQRSSHQ